MNAQVMLTSHVIPGGGWRVEWQFSSGNTVVEPILAWAFGVDGSAVALVVDERGTVEPLKSISTPHRVLPPVEYGQARE